MAFTAVDSTDISKRFLHEKNLPSLNFQIDKIDLNKMQASINLKYMYLDFFFNYDLKSEVHFKYTSCMFTKKN